MDETSRLRLGVVGLGRNWRQRFRPVLRRRSGDFAVQAVCDATFAKARAEAKRLDCVGAEGVVELVERNDVDAVLLCDHDWRGLWPMEMALQRGKPVLCVPPLLVEGDRAEATLVSIKADGPVVVFDQYVAHSRAATHLLHLVNGDTRLGAANTITCDVPATDREHVLNLIWWLEQAFGGETPKRVQAWTVEDGLSTWMLSFGQGRSAQITLYPPAARRVRLSARVHATGGVARWRFPDHLTWRIGRTTKSLDRRRRYVSELATLGVFKNLITRADPSRRDSYWLEHTLQVYRMAQRL